MGPVQVRKPSSDGVPSPIVGEVVGPVPIIGEVNLGPISFRPKACEVVVAPGKRSLRHFRSGLVGISGLEAKGVQLIEGNEGSGGVEVPVDVTVCRLVDKMVGEDPVVADLIGSTVANGKILRRISSAVGASKGVGHVGYRVAEENGILGAKVLIDLVVLLIGLGGRRDALHTVVSSTGILYVRLQHKRLICLRERRNAGCRNLVDPRPRTCFRKWNLSVRIDDQGVDFPGP